MATIVDVVRVAAASSSAGSSSPGSSAPGSSPRSPTGPTTLTGDQTVLAVFIVAAALLAAGGVVIWARTKQGAHAASMGSSYIRAWLAIALVLGLLIFCALSFGIDDATLRSTLMGGLTASVGAAIAFYFSSNSAARASEDLLTATGALETVPNLVGLTHDAAVTALGKSSFKFETDPTGTTDPPATTLIDRTTPKAGAKAAKGSTISAHFP
jgi:hypothetical protein